MHPPGFTMNYARISAPLRLRYSGASLLPLLAALAGGCSTSETSLSGTDGSGISGTGLSSASASDSGGTGGWDDSGGSPTTGAGTTGASASGGEPEATSDAPPDPGSTSDATGTSGTTGEPACDEQTPVQLYLSPDDSNSMASPVLVREARRLTAFATPKSMSFEMPTVLMSTFCGESSRWTTPSGLPSWFRSSCAA